MQEAILTVLRELRVRELLEVVVPLAVNLAAVGVVTMAVWQFIKDTLFLHDKFNRWQVGKWVQNLGSHVENGAARWKIARAQLVNLATGGHEKALYALDPARLAAQLASAARVALAFPTADQHRVIFDFISAPFGEEYKRLLVSANQREKERRLQELQGAEGAAGDAITAEELGPDGSSRPARLGRGTLIDSEEELSERRKLEEIRSRLEFLVQRRIDAFQISLDHHWGYLNRIVATLLSFFLIRFALIPDGVFNVDTYVSPQTLLLAGVAGAVVAPVAKDLAATLSGLRGTVAKF